MSDRDLMTEEAAVFTYLHALLMRKMIRVGLLTKLECQEMLDHMDGHFEDQRATGARNICKYLADALAVPTPGDLQVIEGGKKDDRSGSPNEPAV